MTKKEKILLVYRKIVGLDDVHDLKDKIPVEKMDEIIAIRVFFDDTSIEVKESIMKGMEIAIDTLERENGDNYTEDDLRNAFLELMLLTDPNNKISPFAMNHVNNN